MILKYPIAKKRHTFEYLRTQAHLRPRTNTFGAITRVRTTLANAIHNYFLQQRVHWINTPIIIAATARAPELFRVVRWILPICRARQGEVDFREDFFAGKHSSPSPGSWSLKPIVWP
ncbi:MAG: amino acid--tRNA ligase-related protein [Halioglobus sp.]